MQMGMGIFGWVAAEPEAIKGGIPDHLPHP
jgi:hypothetical protein